MISNPIYRLTAPQAAKENPDEARQFTRHLSSLTATKLADGLIDPKLILSWLLTALGAQGALIGALVPVREAGALLPQLALSRGIERRAQRKWVWVAGAAGQGVCALGIAVAAVTLDGAAAGWVIVLLLAALAVSRAACSTSYKDILARTLAKGARGTVSGTAGTLAACAVFAFALALSFSVIPRTIEAIAAAIACAGLLWIGAALMFSGLAEPAADPAPLPRGDGWRAMVAPLREDAELRRYIATRALLIATALAPPFLVMLSGQSGGRDVSLGNLGLLVLASALASILSSYIWGRLSDVSSRRTMIFAGACAAVVLGVAAVTGFLTGGLGPSWMVAGFVFVAQIAYEGARAGRKTHLTDMESHDRKALYTALSNSMIGVLLLVGGGFGVLADLAGVPWVLALFAAMCAAGAACATGLNEVQDQSRPNRT